ncbi:hypothetical protein K432DRAFT_422219 [Lepidopterella palustris CBS 459.81]|uniref:F-box domain-containing protein n=1 Tax=Lepidopterella palustris CBS 459.81 TaxID=1314670 RepID=A0A8E2JJG5_9PEZI|nr:hypothetical protein K432DRAFT_422219 [Lepidopterella palustris CBS 459.81]
MTTGSVASSSGGYKKRSSISRAAESFQSILVAPFRSGEKKVKANSTEVTQSSSASFGSFFRLPIELHVQILCELSISDILALRRTSRAFNGLVSICQSPLVRFWAKHKLGSLHTSLYPPPPPNQAELHYLLAMRRRHIASIRLTRHLVNYVLRGTLKHTSARQRKVWISVYDKMIPLVFAVDYFLDEHRRVVLKRDVNVGQLGTGYGICHGPAITEEEKGIIGKYDPQMRLQYFYMYCFILQVLKRKLRPPTYVGSVEKIARGWVATPASSEDIAFVLVMGGVDQVAKLLACKNYNDRRKALDSFIKSFSPIENASWREVWNDLDVESAKITLEDIPRACIGVTKLEFIWESLMMELMAPKSSAYTEAEKAKFAEVRGWKRFVNELMGYDVLRGRPNGDDSEAQSEAEHGQEE